MQGVRWDLNPQNPEPQSGALPIKLRTQPSGGIRTHICCFHYGYEVRSFARLLREKILATKAKTFIIIGFVFHVICTLYTIC